jgi:hypothetical protein
MDLVVVRKLKPGWLLGGFQIVTKGYIEPIQGAQTRLMSDELKQNLKDLDQGAERTVQRTPEAAKDGGVIAASSNQKVHNIAFEETHKNDKTLSEPDMIAINDGETVAEYKARVAQIQANRFGFFDSTEDKGSSAETTGVVVDYKPLEVFKNKSFALGMDYEERHDSRSVSEKLTAFAESAGKQAADPEGLRLYIQGELDKMIGVGEGLNIAKEQTKGAVAGGWEALSNGTVANFLSKPNAINDPLFHAVSSALTAMKEDPNSVNHALELLGTTVMSASERYSALSNREKGHVIGETMFALIGPEGMQPLNSKTAEQLGLASMREGELSQLGIRKINFEAIEMHMPELPPELRKLNYQPAAKDLLSAMEQKGRTFSIATEGSEDLRRLNSANAQGSAIGDHITLRENARKITALEEFLHGTQRRLPSFEDIPDTVAEVHVKDFMLRHAKMLGLDQNDLKALQWLKEDAIERAAKNGYTWKE